MILDQKNAAHPVLVKMKIYLPPLHTKFGLLKIYVKVKDSNI
jgi:hypothetical protein